MSDLLFEEILTVFSAASEAFERDDRAEYRRLVDIHRTLSDQFKAAIELESASIH